MKKSSFMLNNFDVKLCYIDFSALRFPSQIAYDNCGIYGNENPAESRIL